MLTQWRGSINAHGHTGWLQPGPILPPAVPAVVAVARTTQIRSHMGQESDSRDSNGERKADDTRRMLRREQTQEDVRDTSAAVT
jgi:hypothetical protein